MHPRPCQPPALPPSVHGPGSSHWRTGPGRSRPQFVGASGLQGPLEAQAGSGGGPGNGLAQFRRCPVGGRRWAERSPGVQEPGCPAEATAWPWKPKHGSLHGTQPSSRRHAIESCHGQDGEPGQVAIASPHDNAPAPGLGIGFTHRVMSCAPREGPPGSSPSWPAIPSFDAGGRPDGGALPILPAVPAKGARQGRRLAGSRRR